MMEYEPIICQNLRHTVRNSSGKQQRQVDSIRNYEGSSQGGILPPWEEEFFSFVGPDFWMSLKIGICFLMFILTSVAASF